jgi:hypothetical protein
MGMTFADMNGDGFNDIIYKTYNPGTYEERVNVIFGHSGVFPAIVNINALAVGDGFSIVDSNYAGYIGFGRKLSSIGDVNHDGIPDLLVVQQFSGNSFVIFGSTSFNATTTFDVATLDGTNGFKINQSSYLYISGVAYIGDVNGDGIADIALSDFTSNGFAGAVHIIFGSADPFPAVMDIIQTDPTIGFTIEGINSANQLGSIGGGGDLNGDGLDDIVVNNYHLDAVEASTVVFGSNFSGIITHMGTSGADVINGTTGDDVIYGAQGSDTLDGLGGNDFISGGSGLDIINGGANDDTIVFDFSDTSVDGGTGTDTLWFRDDGVFADLVGSAIFTGIDVIDLHSLQSLTGIQLTLDAAEVNSMSDSAALTVNGDGLDGIVLSFADGWVSSTPIPGYTTYTSAAAGGAVVNASDNLGYVHLV